MLRDRDHPSVVIWSAANEWSEPIPGAVKTILEVDATRPIIADGVGDLGAPYINMEHYVTGMPGLPTKGGHPRADRPFGETEAVWRRQYLAGICLDGYGHASASVAAQC